MMTMAQVALFGNLRSDGDNELKINKKMRRQRKMSF